MARAPRRAPSIVLACAALGCGCAAAPPRETGTLPNEAALGLLAPQASDERLAAAGPQLSATGPGGSDAARAAAPRSGNHDTAAPATTRAVIGEGSPAPYLGLQTSRLPLPAGRSLVRVDVPAGQLVSIAVLGEQGALLGFDVAGSGPAARVRSHAPLDEDGMLPRVVSLRAPPDASTIAVVVDAARPVILARVGVDTARTEAPAARALRLGEARPRPLIGLPAPGGLEDGYVLQSPGRYQFVRVDVALSLMAALRQTRVRFRRDPIAVADCTQWDGVRPATDLGRPRHISHEGGRDVDLALPASDESPSTVRAHCSGVLVEQDVQGCAPGTARGVDAQRLAYLLGLLIEGYPRGAPAGSALANGGTATPAGPPPAARIERIYTDDVYVREIRRAAEQLRDRRWLKDFAYEALLDEQLLRPSHWHTDHVHIRFTGEPGRTLF